MADFPALRGWLSSVRPAFIVNCAGIVKQRSEARDPVPSITVNSLLPHQLASAAAGWGGRVIHFSTDCVFSGDRGNYTETDLPDARDLYGRTKFLGEVASENALTLRTSIIGRELAGRLSLLEWFLSQRGRTIRGFKRVIYSGVTTNHMAALVADIIRAHPALTGLYQVAAAPISKYDLLCLVRDSYGIDVTIVPDVEEVSDRSMTGGKLREAIGYVAPQWPELIGELASDPTPYDRWAN